MRFEKSPFKKSRMQKDMNPGWSMKPVCLCWTFLLERIKFELLLHVSFCHVSKGLLILFEEPEDRSQLLLLNPITETQQHKVIILTLYSMRACVALLLMSEEIILQTDIYTAWLFIDLLFMTRETFMKKNKFRHPGFRCWNWKSPGHHNNTQSLFQIQPSLSLFFCGSLSFYEPPLPISKPL